MMRKLTRNMGLLLAQGRHYVTAVVSLANEVLPPLRRPPLQRGVVNLQLDKPLRRISSSRVKNRVCAAFLD